ncbi:hypothetical protein [Mucilaginibacter myungsuensis]|uniref:Nucleotide-diphospho-sugar transferase n=1 Tax=Mucilaginibacter myungsuensis TaxID=649104 RepID=A0A929KYS4_9SPHI|nr:hypothetical protein [Mucilaginibacter myungsuensis]MBE9662408.1 hypothetical protein [Mucilaginibacter myungsuensis]MDN3599155.1 hypothetical protein [Mucilaginibacter myungsuensis]
MEYDIPILLLAFNRPDTTQLVFDQIRAVKPRYLYISTDGAREGINGEADKCETVRNIITQIDWDCEIRTYYRDKNYGCGTAVSSGISWFFEHVDMGIILEDDCLPDPTFFEYCKSLLERYKDNEEVKLISGTSFITDLSKNNSYYFTKYANIWGWATWRRVWQQYRLEIEDLEETFISTDFSSVFYNEVERRYWYKEFKKVELKQINTWDYQLLYSIWKSKGVCISPNINLIKNIGFSNNSTRTFLFDPIKMPNSAAMSFPLQHPSIEVDDNTDKYIFLNAYSHSPKRLLRLLKKNGLMKVFRYITASFSIFYN